MTDAGGRWNSIGHNLRVDSQMKFMNLADILYDPFDQFDYFFYLVSNFGLSN